MLVTRSVLIRALQVYVPNVIDLEPDETTERYVLSLRTPEPDPRASGALPQVDEDRGPEPGEAPVVQVQPLEVTGLVLTKAALLKALRIYVPTLVEIEPDGAGDRYVLTVGQAGVPE